MSNMVGNLACLDKMSDNLADRRKLPFLLEYVQLEVMWFALKSPATIIAILESGEGRKDRLNFV